MPNRAVPEQNLIANQITDSLYSKQGQTTTTGIFESRPENDINKERGFTTPSRDPERIRPPRDIFFKPTKTVTYLDTIEAARVAKKL